MPTLWLLRHGETPWTLLGRHTGRTDIGLTARGQRQAVALGQAIAHHTFAVVLTSPLRRAKDTCSLAGHGDVAAEEPDLMEWDYGAFEGKTTLEIREQQPLWTIWDSGVPAGEAPDSVGGRADRVIARALAVGGDVAIFAHGHLLKVLAARWLGLPPSAGGLLALDTASVSVLEMKGEHRLIRHWNEICHLEGER